MNESTDLQLQGILQNIKYLKGVGEHRARLFGKLGVVTLLDLMEYFPRAYMERKLHPGLYDLKPGAVLAFTAMISWVDIRTSARGKNILNVGVNDGKVGIICSWFSYPKAYEGIFLPGRLLWLSGIVSEFNGQLQMVHPEFEIMEDENETDGDFWKHREVLPIYRLTDGLNQKLLRRLIYNAFALYAGLIEENLPPYLLEKHAFPPRKVALQKMHFSLNPAEAEQIRSRFAYEELFFMQLMWARHRSFHTIKECGIVFENKKHLTRALYDTLPYSLTGAQKRVLREIFADMCSTKQMSRLLQGDVGCGKTVVTLFAMLLAVENGYQAALMAPTEILAEQHYQTVSQLTSALGLKICLLKGGSSKGKNQDKADLAAGMIDICIGTHALLQKDVSFAKLGFVCVDEQHRFGVEQRARLARMATHPDLLYLSATPIPRSLAMTVYGDLEVSIINELPPTRKPVQTLIRSSAKIDLVYSQVRKELEKGQQVYVVCPLVEESEKLALLDATQLYEYIATKIYPEYSVELLHGRMHSRDKEAIMCRFKAGETKILVTTTVIEVGVDVPSASVMMVEHAERFGLAALHQLRGRVGRGSAQSYCYLIEHQPLSAIARERLGIMAKTTDGFVIAEKDLELRGPGEFFGYEQSGMPLFRFANLMRDQSLLQLARGDAMAIIREDPQLESADHSLLKKQYQQKFDAKEDLILY